MIKATEYCIKVFDGTHDSPKPADKGFKLLTSKNIMNGYLDKKNAYLISEEDYEKINKRSKVHKWDVLFSMIGTVGNVCLIEDNEIDYAIKNMGVFSCGNEYKAKWLYFYLQSPYVKKLVENFLNGAIQKFLPLGWLRELEIPSFNEEKMRIVDILWNFESKIKTNHKINAELESMAKTLYDYWFLQFEFPNENGKPYKSSGGKMVWNEELKREIPEGWEVKNAYEIADIKTGKEDANHATKNGKYPFFTCANDVLRCDDYKFDGNVILIAGNGDFNVKHYNGKFNAYQRTYVITPHNDKYVGVFHLSCKQTVEKFIKGSNGSIVKFITLRDIQNIKILDCKNDKLLEPFNVFLEKIDLLKKENQELLSLRDFLLPLLMNGQVKFKDK